MNRNRNQEEAQEEIRRVLQRLIGGTDLEGSIRKEASDSRRRGGQRKRAGRKRERRRRMRGRPRILAWEGQLWRGRPDLVRHRPGLRRPLGRRRRQHLPLRPARRRHPLRILRHRHQRPGPGPGSGSGSGPGPACAGRGPVGHAGGQTRGPAAVAPARGDEAAAAWDCNGVGVGAATSAATKACYGRGAAAAGRNKTGATLHSKFLSSCFHPPKAL